MGDQMLLTAPMGAREDEMSKFLVRYAKEPEGDWMEIDLEDDEDAGTAAQVFAEIRRDPCVGSHTVEADVRTEGGGDTTRWRVYIDATWSYTAYELSVESS